MNANAEKSASAAGRGLDLAKWAVVIGLVAAAVVGNAVYAEWPLLYRVLAGIALIAAAGGVALVTDKGREFTAFAREAMVELRKIVWPTRQERFQTTIVVLVVVFVMALILAGLDWVLNLAVSQVIG